MIFEYFDGMNWFAYKSTWRESNKINAQQQVSFVLPKLIQIFAPAFLSMPFRLFGSGTISLTSRMTNSALRFLESAGPTKEVLDVLNLIILQDRFPAVSPPTAFLLLSFLEGLRLVPENSWKTFSTRNHILEHRWLFLFFFFFFLRRRLFLNDLYFFFLVFTYSGR
jgi:hypothetical protein